MDRSAWRLAINMLEPWSLFLLSPFTFQSTCYLVHFLFPLLFFCFPNMLRTFTMLL
jgi:hypothetical protein